MEREDELAVVRGAYAKQVLAAVSVNDLRMEAAFTQVPREAFLGPGPWILPSLYNGDVPTPDADPVYLYVDSVVQIVAERNLNNGQPSSHAKWLSAAGIKHGEHVVHVGVGTGYYTAIMAHLTGASGKVTAIELDSTLAARAKANLASFAHVQVTQADGCATPLHAVDVIYVVPA